MKVVQNIISRDWTVEHKGKTYYVNYTDSDGQTLALLNRDCWEIEVENEGEGTDILNVYVLSGSSPRERREARKNVKLFNRLIAFCIRHWDVPDNMRPALEQEG